MSELSTKGLLHFLQQVPDPRGREGQRHCHVAMLAALICATLCGFPGYAGAAQWIKLLPIEFWHQLGKLHRAAQQSFVIPKDPQKRIDGPLPKTSSA
ncbi:MAG: transposase family protein [Planctomycetaceae bacterium]